MEWFLIVVRDNYSNFNGRASRKEYWMFYLFYMIFAIVAMVVDVILGFGFVYLLYVLALLIPGLAVGIRRLHDVGKSGWWLLISLIPLIGAIWIIVLLATDGTADNNIYGPTLKTAPNTTDEVVPSPTSLSTVLEISTIIFAAGC